MPATKEAKGFFYSLIIIGTLVLIASFYSTVWAGHGGTHTGTVPTLPTLPGGLAYCDLDVVSVPLITGRTHEFEYTGRDISNDPISGLTVTWSVVSGGGTIDSNGLFTAGSSTGTSTVKGSALPEGQLCEASATVTVVVDAAATAAANAAAVAATAEAAAQAAAASAEATAVAAALATAAAIPTVPPSTPVVEAVTVAEIEVSVQTGTTETGAVTENPEGDLTLITAEQQVDVGGDVGEVAASISVDLLQIPANASLTVTVSKEPDPEASASFVLAAADAGTEIVDIAYTINVQRTNLSNDTDLGEARITMSVSETWVDSQGGLGNVRIFRFGDDGTRQVLETNVVGRTNGDIIFVGISPNGLSIFGLVALEAAPPIPPPPGGAITAFAPGFTSTLISPDGGITVTIPASAPEGSFLLVYGPKAEADAPAASPAGLAFGTTLFDLSVVDLAGDPVPGASFRSPITLSVKYTDEDIQAAEGNPDRLILYKYDPVFGVWAPLTTSFDIATKTVQAHVSRLSFFALMGQAQPPTPTPTPTLTGAPTATLLPPTPGDVAPGSSLLIGLLMAAFILIAAGSYYLRQSKQS